MWTRTGESKEWSCELQEGGRRCRGSSICWLNDVDRVGVHWETRERVAEQHLLVGRAPLMLPSAWRGQYSLRRQTSPCVYDCILDCVNCGEKTRPAHGWRHSMGTRLCKEANTSWAPACLSLLPECACNSITPHSRCHAFPIVTCCTSWTVGGNGSSSSQIAPCQMVGQTNEKNVTQSWVFLDFIKYELLRNTPESEHISQ